jgi:tetratricopeptide (TPR) repeat protein
MWGAAGGVVILSVSIWFYQTHRPSSVESGSIAFGQAIDAKADGNLAEAVSQYMLAIRLDPLRCGAYIGLGDVVQRQGNVVEALSYFRQALACLNGKEIHVFGDKYPELERQNDIRNITKRLEQLDRAIQSNNK